MSMWHGPFGLYGWAHDEEKDGPRQHLVNVQAYLHGIPRAFICRRFGHRPVIDGYGVAGGEPGKPWRDAKRWVACGRCDTRPEWQGDLPVALWPTLGAPYTGEWTTRLDIELAQQADQRARDRYYAVSQRWHETPEGERVGERPTMPDSVMPAWPSVTWDRRDDEHPGPRGAASVQLLIWQRKRSDFPGYGFGLSLGTGERPIKMHVHGGKLGSLYLGFEEYGRAFLARHLPGHEGGMPDTRVFGLDIEPAATVIRWEFGARKHEWSSRDPKWMQGHINLADKILGRMVVNDNVIDHRDVMVPLPEGRYPARVELRRMIRRRPRGLRPQVSYGYDLTPVVGVPVPGKGESSYDCGDDAHYSQSGPCSGPGYGSEWVTEAVQGFVSGVLRQRSRYGSGMNWTPDAGWPEAVVR